MKSIHENYLRKCLNECIKTTHRRRAYLIREQQRLWDATRDIHLFNWVMEKCTLLYHHERFMTQQRLSKKFAQLQEEKLQPGGEEEVGDTQDSHDKTSDGDIGNDAKENKVKKDSTQDSTTDRQETTENNDRLDTTHDSDIWYDAAEDRLKKDNGQDSNDIWYDTSEDSTQDNAIDRQRTTDNSEGEDKVKGDNNQDNTIDRQKTTDDNDIWYDASQDEIKEESTQDNGTDRQYTTVKNKDEVQKDNNQENTAGRQETMNDSDIWHDASEEEDSTQGNITYSSDIWYDAIDITAYQVQHKRTSEPSVCQAQDGNIQMSATWHNYNTPEQGQHRGVADGSHESSACLGRDGARRSHDSSIAEVRWDGAGGGGRRPPDEAASGNFLPKKFVNLSNKILDEDLSSLLEKGPNFALSRSINSRTMLEVEGNLERGAFALRWEEEIESKKRSRNHVSGMAENGENKIKLRPRFSDTPTRQAPTAGPVTEHSIKEFKHKVMKAYKNHRSSTKANHSTDDIGRLKTIQEDKTIIVKKSDKCKGLVLMSKDDYIDKAEKIIGEYEPVKYNPSSTLDKTTSSIMHKTMDDKFSDTFIDAIKPAESRTAELYGLPKTHKPGIPLRPIVSACGDALDKLSWVIERIITQLLVFVPAHLKNTYDYLERMNNTFPNFQFPPGTIAFTVDVNNLYGNIPTAEAIESTIKMIQLHKSKANLFELSIPDIKALLEHCLKNNFVRFGTKYYRQTSGIAMGNRMAPPLAILFMHSVETAMLSVDRPQPVMYMRYIDDILGIWTHGPEALDDYFDFINHFHPALKFSIERSDKSPQQQIPFLDTLITIDRAGNFTTELYVKPMAAPIIIHFKSAHPMQTKRSVIHSQTIRALRLGSNTAAKNRGVEKIRNIFLSNGYPENMITNIQRKTRNRKQHPRIKQKITYITLPYIDEDLSRKINNITKKSELNVKVAWKGGKTLANTLIRSGLDQPPCPRGNRTTCHACEAGAVGKCHLKNVVYHITCTLCSAVYIGETRRRIRTRFMEHLGDARHKRHGTHFGEHMRDAHPDTTITNNMLKLKLLHTNLKDAAQMKITESLEIRNRRPTINKNATSWKLVAPMQIQYNTMTR